MLSLPVTLGLSLQQQQQHIPYMEATLNQQIPGNTTIMDSTNVSIGSVGSIPSTETPPPGYMSEDGDPMDQNDNMSELVSSFFLRISHGN